MKQKEAAETSPQAASLITHSTRLDGDLNNAEAAAMFKTKELEEEEDGGAMEPCLPPVVNVQRHSSRNIFTPGQEKELSDKRNSALCDTSDLKV